MIRFYYYKHPKTGKIYSDQRMEGFEEKPYLASDGVECPYIPDYQPPEKKDDRKFPIAGWRSGREVFELDSDYVKKAKPKYVQFRDGHKERYDPTKHR